MIELLLNPIGLLIAIGSFVWLNVQLVRAEQRAERANRVCAVMESFLGSKGYRVDWTHHEVGTTVVIRHPNSDHVTSITLS